MNHVEFISFESADALARRAAADFVNLVSEWEQTEQRSFSVALSGGRITTRFFTETVDQARSRKVDFAKVHFFWADERCVPPDDAESNFAMAERLLLNPLMIGPSQVHRIRGELNPVEAAALATEELLSVARLNEKGAPVIDLVFLGMGEDGHVASLFPEESEEARRDPAFFRAVTATKPPPRRVTMGYDMLAAANSLWVLVSGGGKARALEQALSNSGQLPVCQVLTRRGHSRIYSDVVLE
jgi:6-phosphogluconolactonase